MLKNPLSLCILCALAAGAAPALHGEEICESCRIRQASHRDDLSAPVYYEDSEYFNSNLRDGSDSSKNDVTWIENKTPPTKAKKKGNPR